MSAALFGPLSEAVTIDSQSLLDLSDDISIRRLLEIAQTWINEVAPTCFKYEERYLIETLGCYMCTSGGNPTSEKVSESAGEVV